MSNFKVGCSPISGAIYAGNVLKSGMWGAKKHDVTETAVGAVAEHLLHAEEEVCFKIKDKKYALRVVEVEEED